MLQLQLRLLRWRWLWHLWRSLPLLLLLLQFVTTVTVSGSYTFSTRQLRQWNGSLSPQLPRWFCKPKTARLDDQPLTTTTTTTTIGKTVAKEGQQRVVFASGAACDSFPEAHVQSVQQMHEEGVVVYSPVALRGGFNNQRQAMALAITVAYALNRTLVLPNMHHNKHDKKGRVQLETFWDVQALEKVLSIARPGHKLASMALNGIKQEDTVKIQDMHMRFDGFTVEKLRKRSLGKRVLELRLVWGYPFHVWQQDSWLLAAHEALQRHAMHFSEQLFQDAGILHTMIGGNYHAVHYRVGDKESAPLLNCLSIGAVEPLDISKEAGLHCEWPADHLASGESSTRRVTMLEVVSTAISSGSISFERGEPIYIATNNEHDQQIRDFVSFMSNHNVTCIFIETLLHRASQRLQELEAGSKDTAATTLVSQTLNRLRQRDMYTSCVEQLLCAYADVYFPVFPSTWDEYVLDMRRWMDLEHANAHMQLFIDKFLRLQQKRRESARHG